MKVKVTYLGTHPAATATATGADLIIDSGQLCVTTSRFEGLSTRTTELLRVPLADAVAFGLNVEGRRTGSAALDAAIALAEERNPRGSDPIVAIAFDGPGNTPALVACTMKRTEMLRVQAAMQRSRTQLDLPALPDLAQAPAMAEGGASANGSATAIPPPPMDDLDGADYDDIHTDVETDDDDEAEARALRQRVADALTREGWSVRPLGDQLIVDDLSVFLNFGSHDAIACYGPLEEQPRLTDRQLIAFSSLIVGPHLIRYEARDAFLIAAQMTLAVPEDPTDDAQLVRWLEAAMEQVHIYSRMSADVFETSLSDQ